MSNNLLACRIDVDYNRPVVMGDCCHTMDLGMMLPYRALRIFRMLERSDNYSCIELFISGRKVRLWRELS